MAALIGGRGHGPGRSAGVIGVAPESKILSIRVILDESEPGFRRFNGEERWADAVSAGIRRAVKSGADVINLSLVRGVPTKEDRAAVSYAITKGVVVVAGAGNDGDSPLVKNGYAPYRYPASFPGVISVAAVDGSYQRAGFSNRNGSIVVAAPGTGITSAGPSGEYWRMSGTSPACALVSGVAALIRAKHPKLSPALVAQAIVGSAGHRPRLGYDHDVGFGTVDAARALALADRLAGYRSTGGVDPAKRFTSEEPAPVQVVHRDGHLIAGAGAASVIFLAGLTAAVVWVVALRRRRIAPAAGPLPPTPYGPPGPPNGPNHPG
ncbi:MAG: S8 family serine peptidase, partial [Micromonosporaceae bacterium]